MLTLHDILVQLGLKQAEAPAERELTHASEWRMGEHFTPSPGTAYELILEQPDSQGAPQHLLKKVQVKQDGAQTTWVDLETGMPLEPALRAATVKGFRCLH